MNENKNSLGNNKLQNVELKIQSKIVRKMYFQIRIKLVRTKISFL